MKAFAGICPKTRKVVTVGVVDPQSLLETLQAGQIIVPCTVEQARKLLCVTVDDAFNLPA